MTTDRDRAPGTRRILFACNNALMAEHLGDLWEVLRGDHRLQFRVVPPRRRRGIDANSYLERRLPVKQINKIRAHWVNWDLIVAADHAWRELVDCQRCPTLRISHGIPSKRIHGEIYAFGRRAYHRRGHIRYSRMLVSSDYIRDMGVAIDPAWEGILGVGGSLAEDKLLSHADRREEYRENLGFAADDVVVLVTGTWGPSSLFRKYGDALLAAARPLTEEFRFVLSTHPREYQPGAADGRVWGPYLETQKELGFVVRDPSEDWIPYLVASDVILADHTSLALHGIPLRKPVIHAPISDDDIERGGPIWRLRDVAPTIREDASDLRDRIVGALDGYPFERYDELATELDSCPGEAADRHRNEVYALLGLPRPGDVARCADG